MKTITAPARDTQRPKGGYRFIFQSDTSGLLYTTGEIDAGLWGGWAPIQVPGFTCWGYVQPDGCAVRRRGGYYARYGDMAAAIAAVLKEQCEPMERAEQRASRHAVLEAFKREHGV